MDSIPGYHITETVREGFKSVICRATRLQDSASVIIKIHRSDSPSGRETARLQNEYDILRSLDIEGVPRALSIEKHGGRTSVVLENVSGADLKMKLSEGGLDMEALYAIAIGIAGILGELHRNHVVHKDINPINVIVSHLIPPSPFSQKEKGALAGGISGSKPLSSRESGATEPGARSDLHLIDFGIASGLSTKGQEVINPHLLEGSLAYISPEQTGQMNRALDYRTDFYSLGVLFYEMFTGRLPFETDDPVELVHAHIARVPASPAKIDTVVPPALSAIIMKLLEKNAEDRYASAFGLKADLERCLESYRSGRPLTEFVPGALDTSGTFYIPQKLYGRRAETGLILDCFERVGFGESLILLVSGYAGVGKSALVSEVQRPVIERGGYFVSGKFDQFMKDTPFSAVVKAFQDLARQVLTGSAESIAAWRDRLVGALSSNTRLIIDVIPEIELIAGPQPAVPEVGPTETRNRFNYYFQRFITACATMEHPLVVFLDDLQWADSASLNLMKILSTDSETGHLLMIGAFRDNEVSASHPLMFTIDEIAKAGAQIERLELAPLASTHIHELIAETLSLPLGEMADLGDVVFSKTQGNPFFVREYLKTLYEEGLLWFGEASDGRLQGEPGSAKHAEC